MKFNTLKTTVNNLDKKIPDETILIHINGDADKKIPDTNGLVTTTVLNTKIIEVENKIPDPSSLVATTVLNKKIKEVQNKIPGHAKYITTQEFNKLTTNILAARLKQANLVSKTDFDDKLRSFNRKITSNKAKYLEVPRKVSLTTNDYNFSLGTIYFSGNDGSQNTLVYQPTHDTLEFKKANVPIMFLVGNQILPYLATFFSNCCATKGSI